MPADLDKQHESAVASNAELRFYVEDLVRVHGEAGDECTYVPIDIDRPGVRSAIGILDGARLILGSAEFDQHLPSSFGYGVELREPKMRRQAPQPSVLARSYKMAQNPLAINGSVATSDKIGICSLAHRQRLRYAGVVANHEGQATILGVKIAHSRRLYPEGQIIYHQKLYVECDGTVSPLRLVLEARCELICEVDCGDSEPQILFAERRDMGTPRDAIPWMLNFVRRELGIVAC